MNKKLKTALIFLTVIWSIAVAAEYWVAPTTAGGQIVLTAEQGRNCGDNTRIAYITTPGRELIYGCWWYVDDHIHVVYETGVRRAYDLNGWSRKDSL